MARAAPGPGVSSPRRQRVGWLDETRSSRASSRLPRCSATNPTRAAAAHGLGARAVDVVPAVVRLDVTRWERRASALFLAAGRGGFFVAMDPLYVPSDIAG